MRNAVRDLCGRDELLVTSRLLQLRAFEHGCHDGAEDACWSHRQATRARQANLSASKQ